MDSLGIGAWKGPADPDMMFRELLNKVRSYHPSDDLSLIEKAYKVAFDAHSEQRRKSGEPYIIHPLSVALILADLEMDRETIAAGLLHDVAEDTIYTIGELRELFGYDVSVLVDGMTKLRHFSIEGDAADTVNRPEAKLHTHDMHDDEVSTVTNSGILEQHAGVVGVKSKDEEKVEVQAENLRKMFLAMARDIRVIIIKLADRLHNMRTLQYMPPEKQRRIARETLDIYSPIAERMGISRVKIELDDLSLFYLAPEAYREIEEKLAGNKEERDAYIGGIVAEVKEHMEEAGVVCTVDGRVKHLFSIYRKMINQGKSFEQIYDLFAVRIIVESVRDCYAALGVIHEMYTPIPGRFKDYIAMPKPNMYQSLHTTLIGSTGKPFEIQIRTAEMHRAAEYGIAAHWKYKEAKDPKKPHRVTEEEKMAWLGHILDWQQSTDNNSEFVSLVKNDLNLFSGEIFCFTPNGEVKALPSGSTPIDFAYAVHSAVGNKMVGARVNGKMVPIDYQIQNGDRVEIITSQNSRGPSRDWLSVVVSTQARSKINQWFKNELKEDNIEKGREMLIAYCKTKGVTLPDLMKPEYVEMITRKYGFHDWDALLAAVGHGGLKEGQIINRMLEYLEKERRRHMTDEDVLREVEENSKERPKQKNSGGIVVKGVHDLSVHFSKCCSPVPGDEIVGFVTRGRGISVHRTDCVNVIHMSDEDRSRLIEAEWQVPEDESGKAERYFTEITIYANNRSGLLADVSRALTEKNIDIQSMNTRTSKQGIASLVTTFYISGIEELNRIIEKLRNIESVLDVERTTG